MSSLLLYSPHSNGHHGQHVRRIAKKGISLGHEVELATFASSLDHPAYIAMQDECGGAVRTSVLSQEASFLRLSSSANSTPKSVHSIPKHPNVVVKYWDVAERLIKPQFRYCQSRFRYYRLFANHYQRLSRVRRPDIVIIPYLRYCALGIAVLGSPFGETPWAGIFTDHPYFHLNKLGFVGPDMRLRFLHEQMFYRLLRNRTLRTLFTFDQPLVEYVRQTKPDLAQKLGYVPDPADFSGTATRDEARKALGISSEVVLLLVYGSPLSRRKGIDTLLDTTRQPGFPPQVHVLLAGKQREDVTVLLASPQAKALRKEGRLHELDAFLSAEEEHAVFRASDVVWLGYRSPHYGSSGVLVQAGMMGLPVIACDEGLVGWLTEKNDSGIVVSVGDPRGVAEAMIKLVRHPELRALHGEKGRQAFAHHTSEHFAHSILDKLGLTSVPSSVL